VARLCQTACSGLGYFEEWLRSWPWEVWGVGELIWGGLSDSPRPIVMPMMVRERCGPCHAVPTMLYGSSFFFLTLGLVRLLPHSRHDVSDLHQTLNKSRLDRLLFASARNHTHPFKQVSKATCSPWAWTIHTTCSGLTGWMDHSPVFSLFLSRPRSITPQYLSRVGSRAITIRLPDDLNRPSRQSPILLPFLVFLSFIPSISISPAQHVPPRRF